MNHLETWLVRLGALVERLPEYCAKADLGAMSSDELWGLYRFLKRVEGQSDL